MGKLERFLGKSIEFEIDGEKFIFKPLNSDILPLVVQLIKMTDIKAIDGETAIALKDLLFAEMRHSYPDKTEYPDNEVKEFILQHFDIVLEKTIDVNMGSWAKGKVKLPNPETQGSS